MKSKLLITALALLAAGCWSVRNVPRAKVAEIPQVPTPVISFPIASWDAPDPSQEVAGYFIYLGQEPNKPYPPIKLDLKYALHGKTEVPVLHHTPHTYASLSAYNAKGEESARTAEIQYP